MIAPPELEELLDEELLEAKELLEDELEPPLPLPTHIGNAKSFPEL